MKSPVSRLALTTLFGLSLATIALPPAMGNHAPAPEISAALQNDTTVDGGTNKDGITSDPAIVGKVDGDGIKVTTLLVSFEETKLKKFVDVSSLLRNDGSFVLDFAELEKINGGQLTEGEYTVILSAKDEQGRVAENFNVKFTLNRVLLAFVNMMERKLGLINTETDQLILVPLDSLNGFPEGRPQHVGITPDEQTIFIGTDASIFAPTDPAAFTAIKVNSIDWSAGKADLSIKKVQILAPAETPSSFEDVQPIDPNLPIANWTRPPFQQIHAPTFIPKTPFSYLTGWTDDKIWLLNWITGEVVNSTTPFRFGEKSSQRHGINFNPSGTYGLGVGYFYDKSKVEVYSADLKTGFPKPESSIKLSSRDGDGAFAHYAFWLDDNRAIVGAMQFAPTSLTPPGTKLLGQSIWLLDVKKQKADPIIGPTNSPDGNGMFRSPSDVGVVGNKLYVAEENSMVETTFGDDGYISVFDISNIKKPSLIKRFKPGAELPADFSNAHVVSVTPDNRYVYVSSFVSNHLVKIDTQTDKIVRVYGPQDGLDMPHGEFLSGLYR